MVQINMNEVLYDYRSPNHEPTNNKLKKPKEKIKKSVPLDKLIIDKGMYFRDKQGNVYRIVKMGMMGKMQGKYISRKDQSGNEISYTQTRNYKTFYVYDYNAYCTTFCYDEFDVLEMHNKIIDCLYPDDIIIKDDGKYYTVIKRYKNLRYDYLECKGKGGIKCIKDEEIIKKLNIDIPYRAMATVKKGDRIRHVVFGWVDVKDVFGDRLTVSNGRSTFKMYRKDVKEIKRR